MSRYSHSHHNNHHSQSTVHRGRPVSQHEEALANNSFEHFLAASTLKTIFGTYRSICEHLHLKPNCIPYFYPKLKAHVNSWKAKPLWKKFDARVNQKCYNRGKSCPNTRVLIIGAGPCGLRSAIEAQLLGAKVVVVEKRDRMTRNNVLHLWPFVIEDLRALGAKKFFGKFCAGAIDHISIRQLQCILLKVALLLGVEIHTEVSFERLIEPNPGEKTGWRAEFKPTNHPVNQFEFDVIIGADGKRNTLQGFKRKEFRGKLAIAITANFINKRTEAEARVEEISGVAFIFNQKFFKDLYVDTGIDLENIVYYKDDTHYFVMTAKKQSLIDKGVIRQDLSDTAKLLAPENVDRDELMNYAREAAEFSTNYQMPDLEFAVNHYGQPDVAMFDFTSMYAAENASRITELHGYRLLAILVGDSLLEPFWPTGSGCARGFLSSMDAAWAIRSWETATPLQVIAERESIYRLLAQTTPENLNKDYKSYTLDPTTRYPNLNKNVLLPHQVTNLFDTDNPKSIEIRALPLGIVHGELPKKRRRRDSHVDPDTLLGWIQDQIKDYESVTISNITTSFKDGRVLCAIIHHYRPDLLDYGAINPNEPAKNNQIAFDILEKELGIPPVMSGTEMAQIDTPDFLTQLSYLTQIYDTFRCEIPHIKHPKLDQAFSLPRSSTCMVPYNKFPLRPILITPQSSAKVSEEFSTSHRVSTASSSPIISVSQIPKRSIQNVKDQNDKTKEVLKLNVTPNKTIKNQLESSVKSETQISSISKNRGLLRKSKSSNLNSPVVEKREPVHTLKSLLLIRRKRCPKCMQRLISRNIAQNSTPKNNILRSKQSVENSGDPPRIKIIKPLKPSIKSSPKTVSKKKSVRLCSTPTQSKKVSIKKSNPRNFYKLRISKEALVKSDVENSQGYSESTSLTPLPTDTLPEKTPRSSMEGSSEVALNFLKEMDDFLAEQNAAYEKMNNLRVQILRPKKSRHKQEIIPPEIPKILLGSRENRDEHRSDVIIIKNTERGNLGTISIEEVKVFSLDNSIKLVPRLISSSVTDYSTRFKSTDNQVSLVETSNKTSKCQQSQSFEKCKLKRNRMTYRGDKSESSGACKVEDWLVSSNFNSDQREYNDTTTSTDVEMEVGRGGYFNNNKNRDDKEISVIHRSKYMSDMKSFPVYDEPIWKDPCNVNNLVKNNKVNKDEVEIMSPKPIVSRNPSYDSIESVSKFIEVLKTKETPVTSKLSNISPWEMYEGRLRDKLENEKFQTILETEETDLPDPKRAENDIKLRVTPDVFLHDPEHVNRPPSRHKRSTDAFASKMLLNQGDRKPRKRKTMEKIGASVEERQKRYEEIVANRVDRHNKRRQQRRMQTEQFLKSMQMLQSNCKPDHSEPFEDYSIYLYRQTAPNFEDRVKNLEKQFVYVPDRENRLPSSLAKRETDEDFAARIKDMEQKWQDTQSVDKKPKDLLRAIGKIETSDWNIREIEKKIHENKMGKSVNKDKERVPKWSKEQFSARLTKMEKQHLDRQNSSEVKYAEIDKNIKQLDLKLKEGSALDLNQQKVASLTEKLTGKNEPVNPPKVQPIQKSNSKTAVVPSQNSEFCHFCQKRVYLMERLSAEGRFFHRGCFRCQYCQSVLRLGSYMFDREGIHGYRFYCTQHFGMPGELRGPKIEQKKVVPNQEGVSGKQSITGVLGLDLLDRVQTPERVEFANLSSGHISSDHEESPSPIDEDEWTDRNFRNSIIDSDSTDDSSSSRAVEDDSDTATEGEEEIRARELRKQEVRVEPPVPDTGTDTEVNPLSILPKTNDPNTPDLLKLENNTPSVNKSSDNLSTNSNEFNSAESELDDVKVEFQNLPLRKSATTSSVNNNNLKSKIMVKPNFVIPPRKSSFGKEFIPTQDEKPPEPLLIIKRTPSKVNLPKEVGKPKVVVKADFSNAKKYFGDTTKKPFKPAQIKIKAPLVKQQSLPEKSTVKAEVAPKKETFNFEPEDCDMKDVDDYIENLLKHEDELLKPVDIKVVKQESSESDEKISNSIEDLLKALETETCIKEEEEEFIDVKPEEKIEDLLAWMEELDHQAEETEVTKSLTGEKYKNLEDILKKSSDNIISKLSKNNISEFENHLLGKLPKTNSTNLAEENQQPKYVPFILQRSKTDVNCNKRSSVDLDAVKKVNIKKVLEKFENNDSPEPEVKPIRRNIVVPKNIVKRNSFANFSFNRSFEKEDPLLLPEHHRKSIGAKDFKLRAGVFENDNKEKEIDKVKMEKPINKLLQKGIGINKDLDVVKKPLEKHSNKFLLQRKSLPVTKLEGKVFDDHGSDENLSDEFENLVDKSDLNERLVTDLLNEMDLLNDIKDKLDEDEIEITKSDTNNKEGFNDEANNNIEKISPKIDDKEENKTVNYQERLKQLQDHINSIQKNLHVLPVTPESPKTINFDEIEQKISTYPTNFTQNAEDKTIKENNDNNFFQAAVTVKSRTFLPTTNVSDHDQDLDQNIINENVNNQNIIDQINEQNQNHPEINLKTEYTPPVPRRHKKESQIPRLIKQNSVEGETTLKPTPQLRAASVSPSMVRKFEPPPPIKPLRKRSSMSPMLPRRNLEEQNNNNKGSACSLAETNQNLTVKLNPKSTSAENVSSKSHEKRSKNTSNKDKESGNPSNDNNITSCTAIRLDSQIASCESSSESSSEIQNSATEISTDSEFAHDEPTPTREAPKKMFDQFVTKTRGSGLPKKVQVKSSVLQGPTNNNGRAQKSKDIELKFTPLIPSPVIRKPPPISLFAKNEGYSLNRTQSTGGIATKVSLELKKKYLLGEVNTAGNIQKSGSASTLDSKFKSFHTNISDCQKLLKPAPEISASMQVFCNRLNERTSPLSPIFGGPNIFGKDKTSPTVELKSPSLNGLLEITKCASTSCVPETKSSLDEEILKVNETEGRPRSPVHEKSIIVPVIDWEKNKKDKEKYVDSLSSTDSELDVNITSKSTVNNIPRLEVHDDSGAILNEEFDSLNVVDVNRKLDVPKSINGEKKTLNQPKILPEMNDSILPEQHSALHVKEKLEKEDKEESKSLKSGRSSPSTEDINQAALTETELSDWARDGMGSDDLEDVDFEMSPKTKDKFVKKVKIEHVCAKNKEKKQPVTECVNILNLNIENIEFMDTGTESSDDNAPTQNNGYVQFHNDDEFLEDSLSPVILVNNIVETANPVVITSLVDNEINKDVDEEINEGKNGIEEDKNDDSLVVVETGTTTEENTCSDSTVKVVTEKNENIEIETIKESNEDEVIDIKADSKPEITPVLTELETPTNLENKLPSLEFDEHCQRLQSKIEFSNARDSIDIRKTRRKSKPDVIKPDLIQEEKKISSSQIVLPIITTLYKKEEIEKERNLNQKLVQEMVMNKMKAQNKSLERKKRSRNSFSPIRPFELTKSATTEITSQVTPDVLLSTINPLQKSQSNIYKKELSTTDKLPDVSQINNEFKTPKAPPRTKCDEAKRTAEKFKQDARARVRLLSDEDLGLSPEDKLVKLRQKTCKKLKDNETVDIHIQDSIESLVINRERRNSLLYNNDTLKRNTSFRRSKSGGEVTQSSVDLTLKLSPVRPNVELSLPMRTKSVSEINRPLALKPVEIKNSGNTSFCKSDPNLLTDQKKEKKSKDRERRKSITKFITDMFTKKKDNAGTSPPSQSKGFLSRISPKSKTKSKSLYALDLEDLDKLVISPLRRNSISEVNLRRSVEENIPPPIPPLPKNYTGMKDESSDGELDLRKDLSSCDALDQSGITEESSFGRRPNRSGRKTARQAQLKRHRMAQEIQRKLEETEVKTRELELRGVMVEKALRGETNDTDDLTRDEADLLKEWFDLMRERTDLGRYEKELMIRAQELELEDRHARLQHDLRERLERAEPKSKEEVEIEGSIIKEMMEIVAKRDSLISVLEEDRLRHCEEDRDFEEKMLAKGIHLTPLLKTCNK
nr:F-actin-monooxygenase Mical [Onthophagus taurus]